MILIENPWLAMPARKIEQNLCVMNGNMRLTTFHQTCLAEVKNSTNFPTTKLFMANHNKLECMSLPFPSTLA
jgi:hypothetical protein